MLTLLLLAHAQQLLCDDSLLCNNPSASLQPGVPLQPVPPPLQIHVLVRAKLPWKEEDAAAPAQCAPSPQLRHQHQMRGSHVQFLQKVPSIHPQDGREQKRLASLPLSCLGMFVKHQLSTQTISAPNYSQASFELLIIANLPFGVLLWAVFYFRTGCSCLLSAVQNH